ncbi:MAG: P-II family nitrogen regulator, partial [Salinibacter sp.]
MIVAYIRPIVQDEVVERLRKMEVPGASLSPGDGFGLEADLSGEESYGPQVSPYTETMKLEVVCPDNRVGELAEAIAEEAQTGRR